MVSVEISQELYNRITKENNGLPFESALWSIIKASEGNRKAAKASMTMMMGAALGIPRDKLDAEIQGILKED